MSWQSDIVSAIKADAPVASLIGAKVFADIAPGNAKAPFIVYQSISDGSNTTFDGIRNVIFPLVQFSCWAATKSGAIDLSSKLSAAIEGQTIAGGSDLSFVRNKVNRTQYIFQSNLQQRPANQALRRSARPSRFLQR